MPQEPPKGTDSPVPPFKPHGPPTPMKPRDLPGGELPTPTPGRPDSLPAGWIPLETIDMFAKAVRVDPEGVYASLTYIAQRQ